MFIEAPPLIEIAIGLNELKDRCNNMSDQCDEERNKRYLDCIFIFCIVLLSQYFFFLI